MNLNKKLKVLHYPQIPCEPFAVDVKDEEQAYLIQETLANHHLFLYENNFIPDFSNAISVVMWDETLDNEDGSLGDWCDYYNEELNMDWEEYCDYKFNINEKNIIWKIN